MTEPTGDDVVAPLPPAEQEPLPAEAAPRENLLRGLLFSLAAIPVGILAWVVVWQLGFISAIVAFGVVAAAAWLYRRGSGGRIGGAGLAVILVVTLVTLVLSFLAGIAVDIANWMGLPLQNALGDAEFWSTYAFNIFENPQMWGDYAWSIVLSVVFAVLGAFGVVRQLGREARATA